MTVDRIDFSNDSATASPRGPLTLARGFLAATGNSNYGYFGGGYIQPGTTPTNVYSRVDRIDFSNDSATVSRGSLIVPRYSLAATGNSNYGYFGGGEQSIAPLIIATIDRIDFSNDLATALFKSPLSSARYGLAATGNSNYGWFGGGTTPGPTLVATVDRIDFSNDSATASIRKSLSDTKSQNLAATSNTTR